MELELGLTIAREIGNLTFVSTEIDAAFLIAAHLPGFSTRDIEISVNGEGTEMCISGGGGERSSQEVMISSRLAINRDVCIGHFRKVFPIPSGVIFDRIHAVFGEKEGILVVLVPKFTRGELPTNQTDEVEGVIDEEEEEIASNQDQEKISEPEEDEKPDFFVEITEDKPEMHNEEKVEEVEESPPARPPDPKSGPPELIEISEPVAKPLEDQHNQPKEPKTGEEERGEQAKDSPLTLPEPIDISPEQPDEQEKESKDLELVEPNRPPESPKSIENSEENPQQLNESHRQPEEAKEEPKPKADDEAKDLPKPSDNSAPEQLNESEPEPEEAKAESKRQPGDQAEDVSDRPLESPKPQSNEPHRKPEEADREAIGTPKEEREIEREPEGFGEDTDLDLGLGGAGEEEGEKKGRRRRGRGLSLPLRPSNLLPGSIFILSLVLLFLRLVSERNRRRRR